MNIMPARTVTIVNKLGLHARAAARFVQEASAFASDINIRYANKEVSGKSIMGVMMLAAAKGTNIEIIANGNDENTALDTLETLIKNHFGEDE
jgi:phosphocarrier protein